MLFLLSAGMSLFISKEITILTWTAVSIAFFHTILSPDHYLPIVMISRAERWTPVKTIIITIICGIAHLISLIIIGVIGILLGIIVAKIEAVEALRELISKWLLFAFGFAYTGWGLYRAIYGKSSSHMHHSEDKISNPTTWALLTLFAFYPCGPLIPILIYPSATYSVAGLMIVVIAFGITTILTSLLVVIPLSFGLSRVPLGKLERYSHAIAGFMILLCAFIIMFLV